MLCLLAPGAGLAAQPTPLTQQIQQLIGQLQGRTKPLLSVPQLQAQAHKLGKALIPHLMRFYPLVLQQRALDISTKASLFLAGMEGETLVTVMRWVFRSMEQKQTRLQAGGIIRYYSCRKESVRRLLLPVAMPYFRHKMAFLRAQALAVLLGCLGKYPKAQRARAEKWLGRGFRDPSPLVRRAAIEQLELWGDRALPVLSDILHGLSLIKQKTRHSLPLVLWLTQRASTLRPRLQKTCLLGSTSTRGGACKALQWIKDEEAKKRRFLRRMRAYLASPKALAEGKKIYRQRVCYACHKDKGEGQFGSNLTDRYWLFGPSLKDIYKAIRDGGRPGKGMLAYKLMIPPGDLEKLVAYVFTMQKKPLRGKAPEPGAKKYPLPRLLRKTKSTPSKAPLKR